MDEKKRQAAVTIAVSILVSLAPFAVEHAVTAVWTKVAQLNRLDTEVQANNDATRKQATAVEILTTRLQNDYMTREEILQFREQRKEARDLENQRIEELDRLITTERRR